MSFDRGDTCEIIITINLQNVFITPKLPHIPLHSTLPYAPLPLESANL